MLFMQIRINILLKHILILKATINDFCIFLLLHFLYVHASPQGKFLESLR